jgi:hypothetical protein
MWQVINKERIKKVTRNHFIFVRNHFGQTFKQKRYAVFDVGGGRGVGADNEPILPCFLQFFFKTDLISFIMVS